MSQVTAILARLEQGDDQAAAELLPHVYRELRALAASKMRSEPPGQTLQPTALVHEAFLRLTDGRNQRFSSQGHFFAAAAEAMRRILVDRARARHAVKRGGNKKPLALDEQLIVDEQKSDEILAIHEALDELEAHDAVAAQLVKLRYFGGMGHQEAASVLELSRGGADRLWRVTRLWLFRKLGERTDA